MAVRRSGLGSAGSVAARRGGGGFKLFIIALVILLAGGGAAGYIYLKKTVLDPEAELDEYMRIAREEGLRAKEQFFKQDYDSVFKASQKVIDAALHAEKDLSQGYFWAARVHLRKFQEGHHYPGVWNVGGVIRFTPPVPDDDAVAHEKSEVLKQMRSSRDADHSMIGEWARSCAQGVLGLLEGRLAEAESKLAETMRQPDADPELHIYLAIARFLQKKFKESAEGLEPHLSKIQFIDAKITWAKAMQGQGLELHLAGGDPIPVYRKAVTYLQGVSSPRAEAARAEILTNWGEYMADRGFGESDVLGRFEAGAKEPEPIAASTAMVARARWYIEQGQPKLAQAFLEDSKKALNAAVKKDVLNLNLLMRRELATLTYTRYLRETGERARAADEAAPVLKEVDAAVDSKDSTDSDRLALGIYRGWIAWTIAGSTSDREAAARAVEALAGKYASDPWPAMEAANLFRLTGDETAREGGDPSASFGSSIELASQALTLKPDFVQALVIRGATYVGLAAVSQRKGEDPAEPLKLAEADFEAALKLNDKLGEAYRTRGIGHVVRSAYLADQSRDAAEAVEAAIRDFGDALKLHSQWAEVYVDRAKARFALGRSVEARGEDPSEPFNKADEDLDRATQIRSSYAEAHGLLGEVRLARGLRVRRQGQDPSSLLDRAARAVTEALRYKSDFAEGFRTRGAARLWMGEYRMSVGKDPTSVFEEAQKDLDQATQIRTHDSEAHSLRGQLLLWKGVHSQRSGRDPSAEYGAALESLNQALGIHSKLVDGLIARGLVRAYAAEFSRRKGEDPSQDLRSGIEDLNAVLGLRPNESRALVARARARRQLGIQERMTGGDSTQTFRDGIEDCTQALGSDAGRVEPLFVRAALRAELAESLLWSGKDPKAEAGQAAADAGEALKRASSLEEALLARSHASRVLGLLAGLQGAKELGELDKAVKDAEAAAKANSASAAARKARALAHLWGSWVLEARQDSGVQQYVAGLKAAEEGLGIDGADPTLQQLKAWAIGLEATHLRVTGAVPTARYEAAIQEADRAVEVGPRDPAALWRRAETLFGFVLWLRLRSENAKADEAARRGLADIDAALSINARDPMPRVVRARFYRSIGRAGEANADASAAVRLCPWVRAIAEK